MTKFATVLNELSPRSQRTIRNYLYCAIDALAILMMDSKTSTTPNHSVHIAEDVQAFLDYLLPSACHWNSAKRGDIAYRGQASSKWPLLPKAFRTDNVLGLQSEAQRGLLSGVVDQARVEFQAVHEFVIAADASGLPITATGARLLLQENPRHIFDDPNWEYSWPQTEIVETLALAQHHGVPTRLLDFSEDPWVASYFAAISAWDADDRQKLPRDDWGNLAVWAIDLRFVRAANKILHRYPERLSEVRVPRANNSYLNAQFAFFLMDRGANDIMARGEPLSLEQVVVSRAAFWSTGNRLARHRTIQTWFSDIPVRQVQLPRDCTRELLLELANRGITKGSLMPSLDHIVESLSIQKSISDSTD